MLVSAILNNSESWTNIQNRDLENLEKSDTFLHRNIPNTFGNPSKAFMYLELGNMHAKLVIMEKRQKKIQIHIETKQSINDLTSL